MSTYAIQAGTPIQCETMTLTWSGASGAKVIEAFVQGDNYFFENTTPGGSLTGTLGSVEWLCDVPAGASIAFELYNVVTNQSDFKYAVTGFQLVQPGTTDNCLRENTGQQATASMAALASSLSSASPQLFTGYTTTAASSTSSSFTSATTTTSDPLATVLPTPSSSSSGGLNAGAVAGGIVGGFAIALGLAAIIIFVCRRRSRNGPSTNAALEKCQPTTSNSSPPSQASAPMGFFRAVSTNPVEAWRNRISRGRPPSASTRRSRVYSQTTNGGAAAEAATGPNSPAGAPTPFFSPSIGPRKGVPEVGEDEDYSGFGQGQGVVGMGLSGSLNSSASYAGLADPRGFVQHLPYSHPRPAPRNVYPPTSAAVESLEAQADLGIIRPPTRLTTPGGEDGRTVATASPPPYQSYGRPNGEL
ncbi:hypothetical protein JCM1840_002054 [Sporobolomyces johnsonii]